MIITHRLLISKIGQSCTLDSDCGNDAPICDFPWVEKVAPYNSPAKVCRPLTTYSACTDNIQCGTGFCDLDYSKTCQLAFPSNKCYLSQDCVGFGLCGTSANVLADGTNMNGVCLRPSGWSCEDPGQCQSGVCTGNKCGADSQWGLGTGGDGCSGDYSNLYQALIGATELPDGSFAVSSQILDYNFCGPKDARKTCTKNADCLTNYQCHTGRCAFTKNAALGSVCTYSPVGGGAVVPQNCASGVMADGRRCGVGRTGGRCVWSSDCPNKDCVQGICGKVLTTTTTTTTTTITTTTTRTSTMTSRTSTSTRPATSTAVTPLPSGASCTASSQCRSAYCRKRLGANGVRETTGACDDKKTNGSACYITDGCISGICNGKACVGRALNVACESNPQCASSYCRQRLLSDGTRDPNSACDVQKARGAACYQNGGCTSGSCSLTTKLCN
ncbi:hypothetical protein V8E36_002820 [Tilletia maclaganii]